MSRIGNMDELLSTFEWRGLKVQTFYQGSGTLAYWALIDGKVVDSGDDFKPSPTYCIDDPEAILSLLGFLTLMEKDSRRQNPLGRRD